MKKLVLSIGILFLANLIFAQNLNPEISKALNLDAKKTKKMTIVVGTEMGSPTLDCRAYGLCIVFTIGNKLENFLTAYGKNNLALSIKKSNYSKEKLNENFINNIFTLDEDYVFSKDIIQKFKAGSEMSGKLLLKKGKHKVVETENYFIILQ